MASENPALKYLAIEICNYEARKGQVVFDREDQEIIERAKQSGEKIIYKQECKPQRVYSLKELFKNNPSVLNPQLTSWINRIKK
ncbi:MAG: hypothetical protein JWM14_724 [Chitinophagaceae bacterium]|nr:hypothetical protein [Chitinophagaceae bacterium]